MYHGTRLTKMAGTKRRVLTLFACCMGLVWSSSAVAEESTAPETCFESRKGASESVPILLENGLPSIKCSPKTGGVLWWGDPFFNTQPLGALPMFEGQVSGEGVMRSRTDKLTLYPVCGIACHNGYYPPVPISKNPRALTMHLDIIPNSLDLQHGNQAIWCLDCRSAKQRRFLEDNFGNPIGFNEPQKLCGKCHGSVYRDWRDGIHGKRIGEWASDGKKRWFVCTECHNPHDVQQGSRHSGFAQIEPEWAPKLPKGVDNFDYELKNADGSWKEKYLPKEDE